MVVSGAGPERPPERDDGPERPPERDGPPRARARAVAAFAAFGMWWGGWGALLPAVQRSAGVDDGRLGAALLLIGAGALASMRITGYLIDRFGGAVLPLSVASLGLVGIGPGLAHGAVPLGVSLALVGMASGAYDVAVNAEATRLESTGRRPLLNLAHAGFSFGVIAGSLGAGVLRTVDVPLTGALVCLGLAVAAVAAWLSTGDLRRPPAGTAAVASGWRWWRPPAPLAALGVLVALAFVVESAWQTWSAVHLERDLGASAAVASVGPAVFGASAGVGRLLAHRLTAPGREGRLVAGGALLAAIGTVTGALTPVTPVVLGAIALAGLGTAACAPSLLSLAGRAAPVHLSGAAVGTVTTVGYLGFVLAPALVGGLARLSTLPTALAAIAVPAVALAAGAMSRGRRGATA